MNNTPDNLVATLKSMPGYVDAFAAAYPGQPDPISFDNFAHAIETFEATLVTPNAPFDQFLMGNDAALNDNEKNGLKLFVETGCSTCHNGVNLGGQDYFPFGVVAQPGADVLPEGDKGRFKVTETASDEYVFRAAPLRNVAITAPYFHSGKVWDLNEAVTIMANSQLGAQLDEAQIADIVAFLNTLTGEQPQVVHPTLPARGTDTPKPEEFYGLETKG